MTLGKKGVLFLVLLCYFSLVAATPPLTSLERVRVTQSKARVRFVFDANQPIQYQKRQLINPLRLVIDISHGTVSGNLNFPLSARNPVKRIRIVQQGNKNLRLVLDLKYLSHLNTFTLQPAYGKPYRLVVDFLAKMTPIHKVAVKKSWRDITVVIDPGHGGKDPGATGPRGTHEKNIVLAIAKKLQVIINHQPGFHAVLTRHRDIYLSLRRRLAIARHDRGDVFIAIHADAYHKRSAHGASVYALSRRGATSEAARWLAKRENESELMGGVQLSDKGNVLKSVLINLSQTSTIRTSLMLGYQMIHFLGRIAYLHHQRVEQAAFVVLKSPDIPSLLVETGFLSSPYEERRLRSATYQERLALAIAKGIRHYFTHQPPRNTWLAYWRAHPRKSNQHYIVHHGDTLTGIAQRYQISLSKIKAFNHLRSVNLREGQVLSIPKSE